MSCTSAVCIVALLSLLLIAPRDPPCICFSLRGEWAQRGKRRSCLPSLCARRASVFALQGVPQPEGLSVHQRVGGRRAAAGQSETNTQIGRAESGRELGQWKVRGYWCRGLWFDGGDLHLLALPGLVKRSGQDGLGKHMKQCVCVWWMQSMNHTCMGPRGQWPPGPEVLFEVTVNMSCWKDNQ